MARTVLHIITGLDGGGAEHMLMRVVLASATQDAPRQIVISLLDEGIHGVSLQAAGIDLHCLNMRRGLLSLVRLPRLIALIRRCRPDAIMTWLYHADLIGTLAAILAGMGTRRIIWNLRCSDMGFSYYSPTTRWTVRILALLSPYPAVVAANSRAGIRHHERLGYRPKRWAYLPNGFDLDEWRPDAADRAEVRAEWGFEDRVIAIGMVARVNPQKDHAIFLAAAQRLSAIDKRLRFILIGRGTEELVVPTTLAGSVLVLGERRNVQKLLRGLDIAILCSTFGEGFPNVVGEAMASAIPCVVSDIGDSAVVVGETGFVVPPLSLDALTDALTRLLAEPEARRRHRGEAARAFIREHYELADVAAQYRALLCSIENYS